MDERLTGMFGAKVVRDMTNPPDEVYEISLRDLVDDLQSGRVQGFFCVLVMDPTEEELEGVELEPEQKMGTSNFHFASKEVSSGVVMQVTAAHYQDTLLRMMNGEWASVECACPECEAEREAEGN